MARQCNTRWFLVSIPFVALLVGGLACGPATRVSEEATEAEVGASPAPPKAGPIAKLEDVKKATIQIEAQGTFVEPGVGVIYNAAGRGSGFVIDPSGIAVTNNHVVTGAALFKVWVGGESDPRNAKVLGVSECSDLAVIDIEGDGYPYLEWYEGEVSTGLPIYVAGFPLGDPEYTLLEGIVSKEKANGESNWASVDYVIEHTALTNPGNSGGPVITEDGKVVGIHYAGVSETEQHYAISKDEALPMIETMRSGEDIDTIGVNGTAVVSEDGSLSGIWVSSVQSGSPADKAGVKAGDIITSLEGLVLATDGTMADYCDILRSRNPGDTMSIDVLRFETQEYLQGQLNGRPLATASTFATELEDQVDTGAAATGEGYGEYVTVTDDYGAIQVEVPAAWTDVDGRAWEDEGDVIGAMITAAADLEAYYDTWSEPGVQFSVSDDLARLGGYVQILDLYRDLYRDECELEGRYEYGEDDPYYRGRYDLYKKCGGSGGSWFLVLSAVPKDDPQAYVLNVQVVIVSDADIEALEHILQSFAVVGELP